MKIIHRQFGHIISSLGAFLLSTSLAIGASKEDSSYIFEDPTEEHDPSNSLTSHRQRSRSQSLGEDDRTTKSQPRQKQSTVEQDLSITRRDSSFALALSCFPNNPITPNPMTIESFTSIQSLIKSQGLIFQEFRRFCIYEVTIYFTEEKEGDTPTKHLKLKLETPQADPLNYFYRAFSTATWTKGPIPKGIRTRISS